MKVRLTVPVASCPAPVRPPRPRPAVSLVALLRAGRTAAVAALLAVAVAACSGGGSPSSTVPSIFTPTPGTSASHASGGASRTPSPSSGGKTSATAKATSSARASASAKPTPTSRATATTRPTATTRATATGTPSRAATATPSATHRASTEPTPRVTRHPTTAPSRHYPVGAPQTGGGGTAGLQDVTLFGFGGAAMLAGLGSLAYRRRLSRRRRADASALPDAPTRTRVP